MIEKLGFELLFLMVAIIPTKRALHMFQQNRYELKRYTDWCKDRIKNYTNNDFLVLGILLILIGLGILFPSMRSLIIFIGAVLLTSIFFYQEKKKKYIKPLVYTARVKRQLVVMIILFLLSSGLIVFLNAESIGLGLLISVYGPWILIYGMHCITLPIENAIKQGYANEAKQILKSQSQLIKIGITGSYGKTSSKNVIQALLSEKYYSLMTPASYNTPMGITRVIRGDLKPIHEVFVCEMGADHVGDIQELSDFVQPKIGVVTSIGPQHLNTFGSLENIIQEKMQLIEKLPSDGIGIINMDNEYIRNYKVKNSCRLIRYGVSYQEADYTVENIRYTSSGSCFTVRNNNEKHEFETKLLGEHNIGNIVAGIAIAKELGMTWEEMIRAVKQLDYVEHRLELKKINGYTFIDNAFNSNPQGAAMSLEVLKRMPGERFVITPGMIDLGEKKQYYNTEFGKKMKGHADVVILVGERQTKPILEGLKAVDFDRKKIHVCKTVKDAFDLVYKLATPEDTILLENDLPDAFNY